MPLWAGHLCADTKNCGCVAKVGNLCAAPAGNGLRAYVLVLASKSGCNAKACGRTESFEQRFDKAFVAEWRFDENLRLAFFHGTCFEAAQRMLHFVFVDGHVTVKSKALAVHARGH